MAHNTLRHSDVVGKKFNRLLALSFAEIRKEKSFYLFVCDCGSFCIKKASPVISGKLRSCGCLQAENKGSRTHGLTGSPEYIVWSGMWARCTNKNHCKYSKYKDRVPPDEWRDFSVFLKDMGPRPTPKHSIDRIDNGKPYGPDNCRWATHEEQMDNRSENRFKKPILFNGLHYESIHAASRITGSDRKTISQQSTRVNPP